MTDADHLRLFAETFVTLLVAADPSGAMAARARGHGTGVIEP